MTERAYYMRRGFAVVAGLAAVLFGWVTMTVPVIAATAPAVITIALAAGAWLLWPKVPPENPHQS